MLAGYFSAFSSSADKRRGAEGSWLFPSLIKALCLLGGFCLLMFSSSRYKQTDAKPLFGVCLVSAHNQVPPYGPCRPAPHPSVPHLQRVSCSSSRRRRSAGGSSSSGGGGDGGSSSSSGGCGGGTSATSVQELTINLPQNPRLRGMSHHHHH